MTPVCKCKLIYPCALINLLEYNSVSYKMIKAVFNVAEFTKLMLYNCIKVVRLKPDQPNQWLRACIHLLLLLFVTTQHECKVLYGMGDMSCMFY